MCIRDRFDIDTGGYPVQRRAKIACCGFNLPEDVYKRQLVICLVVTPGATAWLLTDRFPRLLMIAVTIVSVTSFLGAWVSYVLDGATGGIIVVAQTLLFLLAFVFAPTPCLLYTSRCV